MSYHRNITQTLGTVAKQTISAAIGSSKGKQQVQPTTASGSGSTASAANKNCYLVISPNPRTGWYIGDPTARPPQPTTPQKPDKSRYFIKIGDGNFRDAYFVSNPSFDYKENTIAPSATINNVRPGKYLEQIHFLAELQRHDARHLNDGGNSEWHTVSTRDEAAENYAGGNLQHLQDTMIRLLDLFPTYNWQPNQPFDAAMNQLFQFYDLED